jgi:hypothetical protein
MQTQGDEIWEPTWLQGKYRPESDSINPSYGNIGRMILDQLSGMPDVRTELVIFLRRAIEENRYYVPEELVAESMIWRGLVENMI